MKKNLLLSLFLFSFLFVKAEPVEPVVSDETRTVWYCIQYAYKGTKPMENVIQDMGDNQGLKYLQPAVEHANYQSFPNYAQLWKIVEVEPGIYKLVAKSGRVLASNGTDISIKTTNEGADDTNYFTFKLLPSTHNSYKEDSWTLQEGTDEKGFLHQNGGPTGSDVIIQKNSDTQKQNNSLRFVNPIELGFAENGDWQGAEYVDLYTPAKPFISDDSQVKWYCVQYANPMTNEAKSRRVLQEQGNEGTIQGVVPSVEHAGYPGKTNYAQLWKITGNESDGYALISKSGRSLTLLEDNDNLVASIDLNNEGEELRFGIAVSEHQSFRRSLCLTATVGEELKCLNLAGGPGDNPNAVKDIKMYSYAGSNPIAGNNNAINFIDPELLGFPADGDWKGEEYIDLFEQTGPSTSLQSLGRNESRLVVSNRHLLLKGSNIAEAVIYSVTGERTAVLKGGFEFDFPTAGYYLVNIRYNDQTSETQKVLVD